MTKRLTLVTLMVGVCGVPAFSQENPGHDPNPRAIVHRCMHRINRITHRTVQPMNRRARHCVRVITRLVENEEQDRAAEVADRCTASMNERAENGSEAVAGTAEHCVDALTELEAPEQAVEAVQGAAERATNIIEERRAAAVQRVEDALNG